MWIELVRDNSRFSRLAATWPGPTSLILAVILLMFCGPAWAFFGSWQTLTTGGVGNPDAVIADGAATPDGGAVVTGVYSDSYGSTGFRGILTLRLDGSGEVLWSSRLDATLDLAQSPLVAVGPNGGVFVAGRMYLPNADSYQWVVVKYAAASGERLWLQALDDVGPDTERYGRLAVDHAGNPVLVSTQADMNSRGRWRIHKLSGSDGTPAWEVLWPVQAGSHEDRVNQVAFLPDGDPVLTGTITPEFSRGYPTRMATVRLAGVDGAIVWEIQDDDEPVADQGLAVAVGVNGDITVLGRGAFSEQLLVNRYSESGTRAWSSTLDGVGGSESLMALATNDDVFVVAKTSLSQMKMFRLNGSDGTDEWNHPLPSLPGSASTMPRSMTATANDMVHVASEVRPSAASDRAVLQAVQGSTGATAWTVDLELPVSGTSRFLGAASLADGNVLLFVPDRGDEGGNDYRVDKLHGQDGALIWSRGEIDQHMPDYLNCGGIGEFGDASSVDESDGSTVYMGCRTIDAHRTALIVEKRSVSGALLWSVESTDWATNRVLPVGLRLDEFGHVHLAFVDANGSDENALTTVRLSGIDGSELQRQIHVNRADPGMAGFQQVLDSSGFRYVSWPETVDGVTEIVLARYQLDSTVPAWDVRIPGPAGGTQWIKAIGLDAAGNPVLGGSRTDPGANASVSVMQVRSKDSGELLWYDVDPMLGGVHMVAVDDEGHLLVGRGFGLLSSGIKFSKHATSGVALWRTPALLAPDTHVASLNAMTVGEDGSLYFAGRSNTSFLSVGTFLVGRVRGSDGALLWLDRHMDPLTGSSEANVVLLTPSGLLRVAGFDADTGLGIRSQSMVVDYDPNTGERLAVYPQGGSRTVRLHPAGAGTYRLVDSFRSLEGARIRVRRLEDSELLFSNGFEVLP